MDQEVKSILKSKTFWVNLLTLVVLLFNRNELIIIHSLHDLQSDGMIPICQYDPKSAGAQPSLAIRTHELGDCSKRTIASSAPSLTHQADIQQ